MDRIIQFLEKNQWSEFNRSLLNQVKQGRQLSQRQLECVEQSILRAESKQAVAPTYSIAVGAVIEVKAWIARRLQADLAMPYFFRNLEVVAVLKETAKAYQVNVRFVSRIVTSCHICGKALDTDVSRATGIGPVCADRLGLPRPTIATAQETLKALDALCGNIGVVGPIWIPKSQVKRVETCGEGAA